MIRLMLRIITIAALCGLLWLAMQRMATFGFHLIAPQWMRDWSVFIT